MRISPLDLPGSFLVEPELISDERGFFARAWCAREFEQAGIGNTFVQASLSHTNARGSVRGMHYQRPPSAEAKLVRCIRGAVLDVIVDIRPDSDSFLKHQAVELSAENRNAIFIPAGMAHGFQTLVDNVEIFYEMTDYYQPELADGFRWDDELLDIRWPQEIAVIHERDAAYPDLDPQKLECFRGLNRLS